MLSSVEVVVVEFVEYSTQQSHCCHTSSYYLSLNRLYVNFQYLLTFFFPLFSTFIIFSNVTCSFLYFCSYDDFCFLCFVIALNNNFTLYFCFELNIQFTISFVYFNSTAHSWYVDALANAFSSMAFKPTVKTEVCPKFIDSNCEDVGDCGCGCGTKRGLYGTYAK